MSIFLYSFHTTSVRGLSSRAKRGICIFSAQANSRFLASLGMTKLGRVTLARHGKEIEHATAEPARAEAANALVSLALRRIALGDSGRTFAPGGSAAGYARSGCAIRNFASDDCHRFRAVAVRRLCGRQGGVGNLRQRNSSRRTVAGAARKISRGHPEARHSAFRLCPTTAAVAPSRVSSRTGISREPTCARCFSH